MICLKNYTQKEMAPSSAGGGNINCSQEVSHLLLSMPPADRRRAHRKVLRTARVADKIAEAILKREGICHEKRDEMHPRRLYA